MMDLNLPAVRFFQTPESELIERLSESRPSIGTDPFHLTPLLEMQRKYGAYASSYFHHDDRDFSEWRASALRLLRERLVIPRAVGSASEARLISRTEYPDYIVEELEISVTPPLRAPATVVIPRNGRHQHPAVVALHSMGGIRIYGREKLLEREGEASFLTDYRNRYYGGRSLLIELARAGYLSISIDAFNFGHRTPAGMERSAAEFDAMRSEYTLHESNVFFQDSALVQEPFGVRALECAGLSLPALVATDDLRTVDYLLSRRDVDPQRIGCIGFSFGGFRAHYLSALSPHISAAVSVCWTSTMEGIVGYNVEGAIGFFSIPPGLYQQLDPVDIIAVSAPKAFLSISAWRDPMLQPSAMARAHLFMRKCWRNAGAEEKLGSLCYDAPHAFNLEMQEDAIDFLNEHLGGALSL